MKMHPRTLQVTSAVAALLCFVTVAVAAQAQDFTYVTNNGAITITGYTGSGGDVTIPETIDGLPVACIDALAFFGQDGLTSATLPNSVTIIGLWAFGNCINLANVTISEGVTTIEDSAFAACPSLTRVIIGNSIATIGPHAFSGCTSLTSIAIPASVTKSLFENASIFL